MGLTMEIVALAAIMLWRVRGSRWLDQGMANLEEPSDLPVGAASAAA